ncbi:hypothetical protein EDEG_01007 [Edhazardia aedis USNM 41457]|uniref:TFIID subunit TAF5 NTD2 domain-containing protein n=1 Tax=Edhazardia aedis (strain USNM 41457) TaxID=1003232 RepID=J9DQE8_EDHAE|nr:hypothetical protein EDEG_01007 [Edhazardia aedis USNM 41457]|eukprot:EJW04785.1 hypothetical protein EDEG_01007 [Edhazardia aedis USNM 41457]
MVVILKKHILQNDDPDVISSFSDLKTWVEESLDIFRDELLRILYPLFVHIYLDLIATHKIEISKEFFKRFKKDFESERQQRKVELSVLESISDVLHLRENNIACNYRSHKYRLAVGKYAFTLFLAYLEDHNLTQFLKIVSHYFDIDVYTGTRKSTDDEGISGVVEIGEDTALDLNTYLVDKTAADTVLTGEKYKFDPLQTFVHKNVKGMDKEEKYNKPNVPIGPTIPNANIKKMQELLKRVSVSKNHLPSICCYTVHNSDEKLCCAEINEECTMIALGYQDSYIEIISLKGDLRKLKTSTELGKGEDSSSKKNAKKDTIENIYDMDLNESVIFKNKNQGEDLFANTEYDFDITNKNAKSKFAGNQSTESFENYSKKLDFDDQSARKTEIDKFENTLDENPINNSEINLNTSSSTKKHEIDYNLEHIYGKQKPEKKEKQKDPTAHLYESIGPSTKLIGHSGPIYCLKFFKGNKFLLSCSQDCTVRLWSLELFTCIAIYKAHVFPIWSIDVSADNWYFASGGLDKQAHIWSVIGSKPERLIVSALSDVTVVKFHPNGNYIFTGSNDNKIRMHSVQDGSIKRIFNGHTEGITCLEVSSCGKFLLSGGKDKLVILWDIAASKLLNKFTGNERSVYSVAFCWFGNIIASVGADCSVRIWDRTDSKGVPVSTFFTRNTPLIAIRFGFRNIISVVGPFL